MHANFLMFRHQTKSADVLQPPKHQDRLPKKGADALPSEKEPKVGEEAGDGGPTRDRDKPLSQSQSLTEAQACFTRS